MWQSRPVRTDRTDTRGPMAGRRVLVVGASGGIGSAIAERCVRDGASVVGWDNRPPDTNRIAHSMVVDATDEAAVRLAAERTLTTLDGLDAVVFAAGTIGRGWLHEMSLDEWRRVLDTDLMAASWCCDPRCRRCSNRAGAS